MDELELKEYDENIDNSVYLDWINEFERQSLESDKFSNTMDIDYCIVDDLFNQGYSVSDAINEYFNRLD